ncbi:hypothetical protein ELQ92_08630 [Labedella populi]|uniref:Uncharacterized protein n=1 Tax=Labedella populi TaxID=2498850 RepID=A0A444QAJ5_9MICO|nr:hypothetical protein [Labedella populi]RWZ61102.1 hypothetical protein ELQ92_08630 [Labedella populi]
MVGPTEATRDRVSWSGAGWRIALAVVFGLVLAWDVREAVGNLLGVLNLAAGFETAISPTGWFVLLLAIALPLVGFLAVLWLGRRAPAMSLFLAYLTVTVVVSALSLDILAIYSPLSLLV